MKMLEFLEKDREKLINDLTLAKTPEKAGKIIEGEMDRLLYSYNEECTEAEGRDAASYMLQTMRTSAPLVDSIGEARLWERDGDMLSGDEKHISKGSVLLFLIGIAASVLAILMGLDDRLGSLNVLGEWTKFIALAIGALALFLSGFFAGRPPKAKGEKLKQTELIIDPDKIYRSIRNTILTVDRSLDQVISDARGKGSGTKVVEESGVDNAQIELFSNLLEALYSEDGDMALSKMAGVKFYLHKKGIDVIDYSDETAGYFDVMPSPDKETVRPALMLNGELLKKGLATGGN